MLRNVHFYFIYVQKQHFKNGEILNTLSPDLLPDLLQSCFQTLLLWLCSLNLMHFCTAGLRTLCSYQRTWLISVRLSLKP